jgi:hypothetical protein
MLDIKDFELGTLNRVEGQQHRLLWAERMIAVAQREAWGKWFKIFCGIIATMAAFVSIWVATVK